MTIAKPFANHHVILMLPIILKNIASVIASNLKFLTAEK